MVAFACRRIPVDPQGTLPCGLNILPPRSHKGRREPMACRGERRLQRGLPQGVHVVAITAPRMRAMNERCA